MVPPKLRLNLLKRHSHSYNAEKRRNSTLRNSGLAKKTEYAKAFQPSAFSLLRSCFLFFHQRFAYTYICIIIPAIWVVNPFYMKKTHYESNTPGICSAISFAICLKTGPQLVPPPFPSSVSTTITYLGLSAG